MTPKTMAARIRDLIAKKGITSAELARRVGVSPTAVYNWEIGSKPRQETLEKLAKELDTTSEYILIGQDPAAKPRPETVAEIVARAEADLAQAMGYVAGRVRVRFDVLDPA